jgi:hypothetical protein
MYLQKVISIKTIAKKVLFSCPVLKSPDPLVRGVDPDPYQNVTDPEHCFEMNVHALGETSALQRAYQIMKYLNPFLGNYFGLHG